MAFINSLTHGTLLTASNTVYLNCLDSLAKKDQEISLLKDRISDLQCVSCLYAYIYADCTSRNQLIQILTSMKSSTASSSNFSCSNLHSVALKTDLVLLQQSDYPNIKHWIHKCGNSSQVSVIKMVDANSMSDNDESLGSDDLLLFSVMLADLENPQI